MKRNSFFRLLIFTVALFPDVVAAQARKMIEYSSGTGFFVTRDGHVLTNNHVIKNCDKISVRGDGISTGATLVAQDGEYDLALLKVAFSGTNMAYFNSMRQPLRTNDPVVIIGYPLDSWRGNDPVVRTSNILDLKGPKGEDNHLQFVDSVAHGNSGGPLLDSAGNVVGVVVAKSTQHVMTQQVRVDYTGKIIERIGSGEEQIKKSDLAISLPVVRKFLERNGVQYQIADSAIYLSPDRVNDRTRSFIVNVTCRVKGQ